jgi:hypothetical protein
MSDDEKDIAKLFLFAVALWLVQATLFLGVVGAGAWMVLKIMKSAF